MIALAAAIAELSQTCRRARTALWCALQLSWKAGFIPLGVVSKKAEIVAREKEALKEQQQLLAAQAVAANRSASSTSASQSLSSSSIGSSMMSTGSLSGTSISKESHSSSVIAAAVQDLAERVALLSTDGNNNMPPQMNKM